MFNHCDVEARAMCWLKRNLWKVAIAIAGMLLLLVFMVWLPMSAAGAREIASGLAASVTVTVQATPTEDATMTALNKEKLVQEVQQLKDQNEPDFFGWLRTNAAILLSTLVVVIGGLIGLFRWFGDRRSEREKRAEERFQSAVTGLGDEKEGARIGAAILLRTFLRPGYEQFYTQTFDLAVANLRLPRTSNPPEDPNTALPITTLRQALIVVFKEAFPLARSQKKISPFVFARSQKKEGPQSLDASDIQLDNAYLMRADLKQIWMPQASLRKGDLYDANLSEAYLLGANLYKAILSYTNLRRALLADANLSEALLVEADLSEANLLGANLYKADLTDAKLCKAMLSDANFSEADLSGVDLVYADLSRANLSRANLSHAAPLVANLSGANLSGANLEDTPSLERTNLRGVIGLTKEQLEACKVKGAIIDEDHTTSSPQPTIVPPSSLQSTNVQALSSPPAQESTPASETDGSSATSSQPGPES